LGLSVGWVRALFVVGTLVPVVPGLPLYLLLWLLVRPEQASTSSTRPPVESSPGRPPAGG
jgi:phage shock protein PspC (stress-responsive transcriptional regulator)